VADDRLGSGFEDFNLASVKQGVVAAGAPAYFLKFTTRMT
jgi:hypothetical protein